MLGQQERNVLGVLQVEAEILQSKAHGRVPLLAAGLYVWLATPECYILAFLLDGSQTLNPKP
jgi:hypothetical protein